MEENNTQNTNINVKRNIGIDLVKGICILFVFVGHSGIQTNSFRVIWTSFFMSSFFIFSGFLFKYKDDLKTTIIHKTKSLLILYYIWTIIPFCLITLCKFLITKHLPVDFVKNIFEILFGINQPLLYAQLWFVIALYSTELLWIFIDKFFKKNTMKYLFAAILAIIGIFLNIIGIRKTIFRLETAFIMLPVFLFGIIIKRYKENKIIKSFTKMNNVTLIISIIIYLVFIYINGKFYDFSISIWNETFGIYPLFYLNAIMGTLIAYNIFNKLWFVNFLPIKYINSSILYFGKNSTTCLVTMNIVIKVVQVIIKHVNVYMNIPSYYIPYFVFIISVLSQIPISIILKNKHLRFLKGVF